MLLISSSILSRRDSMQALLLRQILRELLCQQYGAHAFIRSGRKGVSDSNIYTTLSHSETEPATFLQKIMDRNKSDASKMTFKFHKPWHRLTRLFWQLLFLKHFYLLWASIIRDTSNSCDHCKISHSSLPRFSKRYAWENSWI